MAERGNSDPQHQAAEAPKAQSRGVPWTSLQQQGHLQPAQALLPSKLHIHCAQKAKHHPNIVFKAKNWLPVAEFSRDQKD